MFICKYSLLFKVFARFGNRFNKRYTEAAEVKQPVFTAAVCIATTDPPAYE